MHSHFVPLFSLSIFFGRVKKNSYQLFFSRLPSAPAKKFDKFYLVDFFIRCESNGISSRFSVYLIPVGICWLYFIRRRRVMYLNTFLMKGIVKKKSKKY